MNHRTSLAAAFALALAACTEHADSPAVAGPSVDVRVASAARITLPERYEAGGVVQAGVSATLTSRILAPVVAVHVKPGDRIRAGQVLVQLDDRDVVSTVRREQASAEGAEQATRSLEAECEAADAARVLADASLRRISRLHERQSATPQELDEATASARAARARAASAKAHVAQSEAALASARAAAEATAVAASYTRITAPFDGRVTEKLIEPGDMATPATALLRVESVGNFRVDVRLDESRAAFLAPGLKVGVMLPGSDEGASAETVYGTVIEIARAIDADTRAFLVKIAIDARASGGDLLRSGMFARISFTGASRTALVVPTSAVVSRGQVATVFVVDQDLARLRLVRLGASDDARTEILSGLDDGERVIVSPPPRLLDRTKVRVSP